MGQRAPFKGTSYVGKNNFSVYRLCAMNDQVHYISYIPCVDIFDVPCLYKRYSQFQLWG